MAHWFVVPPLDGPISGGTLYNRELIAALQRARFAAAPLDIAEAARTLEAGQEGVFWIDSLYLDAVPRLTRAARQRQTIGLAMHYLPSLVARPQGVSREWLRDDEREALDSADVFLATSPFMQGAIERLLAQPRPIVVVEPGRNAAAARHLDHHPSIAGMRAILVANLVHGKGIEPFFSALAERLAHTPRKDDRTRIVVVGSDTTDPEYARKCREQVATSSDLAHAVTFAGALAPELVAARLAESNLFVSASRMESFGMALADARAAGLPILARDAGYASFHVHPQEGGELVSSDEALTTAFVRLSADRREHAVRFEQAREAAVHRPVRSWSDAAADFIVRLGDLPLKV
jgi:glycosyltransferase involved in cell wall biosynthesis